MKFFHKNDRKKFSTTGLAGWEDVGIIPIQLDQHMTPKCVF